MKNVRKTNVGNKKCLFCMWVEDLKKAQESLGKKAENITANDMAEHQFLTNEDRPWKSQFLKANEHFFAVLSSEQKVAGHTLIISRDHSWDIADPALVGLTNEVKIAFFDIVTEMARKLTTLTKNKRSPKVYVMSMCEHWTPKELDNAKRKHHTEHLHFHLLPRMKAMRTRYPHYVPEAIFVRCDRKQTPEELEKVRQEILNREQGSP